MKQNTTRRIQRKLAAIAELETLAYEAVGQRHYEIAIDHCKYALRVAGSVTPESPLWGKTQSIIGLRAHCEKRTSVR